MKHLVLAILLILQFSGCGGNSQIRTAESEKGTLGIVQSSEIPRGMILKKYREEKRLALVIGNKDYSDLTSLKNPINDSRAMQTALEKLNFEVFYLENGTKRAMRSKIDDFTTLLKQSKGIGMIFYAGHGLEVGGTNYLIPTDAIIEKKLDVKNESVSLDDILYQLEESKNRLNIVVLDACRNDPFKNRSITRKVLGESKGLATPPSAKGLYIAYSADVGQEAQDGDGKNGTFTKHLLENIEQAGLNLNKVFQITRKDVEIETDGKQSPASYDKTTGDFYFIVPKEETVIYSETDVKTDSKLTINIIPASAKIEFTGGKKFISGQRYQNGKKSLRIFRTGYLTKFLNLDLKKDTVLDIRLKKVENDYIPTNNILIWNGESENKIFASNWKNAIAEYKKKFEPLKPQGEFEKTSVFEERKEKYFKDIQNNVNSSKEQILNLWLGSQNISMKYNPDIEKFSVTENRFGIKFQIYVPLEEAKNFKENIKRFYFLFEENGKNIELVGAKVKFKGKEYFSKISFDIREIERVKVAQVITKWSREFNLGLPTSWKGLQKVRGIIAVGQNYTKKEFEKGYPKVDTTNFYFANTKNKKITYIPKEIGNLTNLTSLYLDSNQIKELPKEIGNLTNLTSLDLGNNQIKELPKEIGNLTNLTSLDLYKNQIKELPKEIGNLTNLTELYLTSNQIKELPKEIGNLTNLTSLYLWDNQISSSEKEKIKKLLPNFEIDF